MTKNKKGGAVSATPNQAASLNNDAQAQLAKLQQMMMRKRSI